MKKLIMVAVVFLLMITFALSGQAAIELRELGRAPLIGPIESQKKNPFDLPEKFSGARLKISEIIKMGMGGIKYSTEKSQQIFDLMELQIKSGNVTEPSLPSGTEFAWMGYESKKSGLQILRNIVWKGKKPMEGFLIAIRFEEYEMKFFIPMDCGNLSLMEIIPIPPAPPEPPTPAIEPAKPKIIEQEKQLPPPPEPKVESKPEQPEIKSQPKFESKPIEPNLKPEPTLAPKKYYYRYYYRYRYYYQRY